MHLTCLAIVFSALAAATAGASPPGAGGTSDVRARIETYLATHDVAQAAELRTLAKAPDQPLMAIAADAGASGLLRARAVAALRLAPSPAAQAFLGKLVEANAKTRDATLRLMVRRAAVALGWMAGPRAPEQLALLFDNDDALVRLDAVIGLGLTRAATAPAHLRRQLAVESAPEVRGQIERQLRALRESPPEADQPTPAKQRPPMRSGF